MYRKLLNCKMIVVLAALLVLFMAVGVAEEEKTDSSRQWKYVVEDGSAIITGYVEKPSGDLMMPGELDGYPVTGIGDAAFYECGGLTSVVIPASVTRIGHATFAGCVALTSVTIPDGVTSIDDSAFARCVALTSVTIPESITSISENVFEESGLTSVIIPGGVTSIGYCAFLNCTALTSVTIPDSVTRIGMGAFAGCSSLTSMTIPANVTDIEEDAFPIHKGFILDVTEGSAAEKSAIGSEIFHRFGEGMTATDGFFMLDAGGQWVYFQEDGKAVVIEYWGEAEGDVILLKELDGYPVTSIDEYAFYESKALVSVVIPEGILSIGAWAFAECDVLSSVMIPASVEDIGEDAFEKSDNVVLSVHQGTFAEQYAMENGIPYMFADVQVPNVIVEDAEKEKADSSEQWEYIVEDGIAIITGYQKEPIGELVIPSELDGYSVAMIGRGAFLGCKGLTRVFIPDSVDSIDDKAFMDCYNLTSVTLPSSITFIGNDAFDGFEDLVLIVEEGSYAEEYAQFSDIPYVFATK